MYYDYLAATTGSGGIDSLKNNNENSPDTFCPLGWQLPYSGTGGDYYDKSKSFRYLKSMYLSPDDTEPDIGKKGLKYPMSFARTGIYVTSKGGLALMGVASYQATITNYTRYAAYKGTVYDDAFSAFGYQDKRDSESIRCFLSLLPLRARICVIQKLKASFHFFISLVHRRHGGRNKCILSRYGLKS